MEFDLTRHAREEIARRQIPEGLLNQVLHDPQQVVEEHSGLKAYQSKLDFGGDRIYLLRAIVDDRDAAGRPPRVITAYRTSKIDKYWSQP